MLALSDAIQCEPAEGWTSTGSGRHARRDHIPLDGSPAASASMSMSPAEAGDD
jgi:hypothetical protein